MKYYKVILSHYCSFKVALYESEDIQKLTREYLHQQNSGEAKSDKLILRGINRITEKEFNECNLPSYQIKSIIT